MRVDQIFNLPFAVYAKLGGLMGELSKDYERMEAEIERLRQHLREESKAREGREALLQENEALRARLAICESLLNEDVTEQVLVNSRLQTRLGEAEALLGEARAAIHEETWAMDLDARIDAFLERKP